MLPSKRLVRQVFLGFSCRWSSDSDCEELDPKKTGSKLSAAKLFSLTKLLVTTITTYRGKKVLGIIPPKPLGYCGRSLIYPAPSQGALTHHLSFQCRWSGTHSYKPEKTRRYAFPDTRNRRCQVYTLRSQILQASEKNRRDWGYILGSLIPQSPPQHVSTKKTQPCLFWQLNKTHLFCKSKMEHWDYHYNLKGQSSMGSCWDISALPSASSLPYHHQKHLRKPKCFNSLTIMICSANRAHD